MTARNTAGQEVMPQTTYEWNTEGKLSMILHQVFTFNQDERQTTVLFVIYSIYLVETSGKVATSGR